MSQGGNDFSHFGFTKTFVLPALSVFLIPVVSLFFFWHAQSKYDADARAEILQAIDADQSLTPEERAERRQFFEEHPLSELVTNPEFAGMLESGPAFDYATFRWMIRIATWSILAGLGVFVFMGVCVLLSLRSQLAQYWSLLIGWHVLRIFGALQTLAQGALLVGLSFWITALWFNLYSPKLIIGIGVLAICAVIAVFAAIFRRLPTQFEVEGKVLFPSDAPQLWQQLNALCAKVDTPPPNQVIVGIDDNFFVTETPVTVDGEKHEGRTLFVSLALLKQLNGAEAEAVLAHEMAHFSGNDTLYSKRIGPILHRYEAYLHSLQGNLIALPMFYFMVCFRALFELSLSRLSRQREFRADAVAAKATSPRDMAGALLRTVAYSTFRSKIENDLFKNEQALETADVSVRIEQGFPAYAVSFAGDPKIGQMESVHPFDSHPPLAQRLSAVGVPLESPHSHALLARPGDGAWRWHIPNVDELERQQWQVFEERFRNFHEETLPYRFLPNTPEERALVEQTFPPVNFDSKKGFVEMDCVQVRDTLWTGPLPFADIGSCELAEDGTLNIQLKDKKAGKRSIATKRLNQPQAFLEAFQKYYGRYLAAVEYQEFKAEEAKKEQP